MDEVPGHSGGKAHPHALARLATRQHGVVSLHQMRELGFGDAWVHKRAAAGFLHRVHRGVYSVGHRSLTVKGRWLAAVLACGPDAVLSHGAALALWGLRERAPGGIDVTVAARGRRGPAGVRVHGVRALHPHDRVVLDAIPVTSVARALLDLADSASEQQLRTVVEAAERSERLDGAAIDELLARAKGRATVRLTRAVLTLTGSPPWTQSRLEREFLEVVREAGLSEPQLQVLWGTDRLDAFWPRAKLIVELDGWRFHRGRARFESDRARDTANAVAGLTTIRVTQRRIERDREGLKADLRSLHLGRGG